MDKREFIESEIRGLKNLLAETDYSVLKTLEGIAECTSATGIINFLKSISGDIRATIENRVAWRVRINELEKELGEMDGYTVESVPEDTSATDTIEPDATTPETDETAHAPEAETDTVPSAESEDENTADTAEA